MKNFNLLPVLFNLFVYMVPKILAFHILIQNFILLIFQYLEVAIGENFFKGSQWK
jgi:hypothetical protein